MSRSCRARAPDQANVDGKDEFLAAIDPATIGKVLAIETAEGSLADLGRGLAVEEPTARSNGLAVGDDVEIAFRRGTVTMPVVAVLRENPALAPWTVSLATMRERNGTKADSFVYVKLSDGADPAEVRSGIDDVLADQPNVSLLSQQDFKNQQRGFIDQLLVLMYALLLLSIVTAALGIINTLVLSVVERRREIGLLRAVGMSRRQVRRMIRLESVTISVFGAMLGLGGARSSRSRCSGCSPMTDRGAQHPDRSARRVRRGGGTDRDGRRAVAGVQRRHGSTCSRPSRASEPAAPTHQSVAHTARRDCVTARRGASLTPRRERRAVRGRSA
ncbi:MAG: ABC transporter permease [Actinomycetota bacterium]|nr:ABC transporter permease [Actinomycetota bacterium]